MEQSKKIFIGNGKEIGTFGTVSLSICLDDMPQEHIKLGKNNKRYISLYVNKNKQIDKFGNTHSITVNTFKPESSNDKPKEPVKPINVFEDDLPF